MYRGSDWCISSMHGVAWIYAESRHQHIGGIEPAKNKNKMAGLWYVSSLVSQPTIWWGILDSWRCNVMYWKVVPQVVKASYWCLQTIGHNCGGRHHLVRIPMLDKSVRQYDSRTVDSNTNRSLHNVMWTHHYWWCLKGNGDLALITRGCHQLAGESQPRIVQQYSRSHVNLIFFRCNEPRNFLIQDPNKDSVSTGQSDDHIMDLYR